MEKKNSLRWYRRICERNLNGRSWRSDEKERVMKSYWSGVMDHRIGEEERCLCVKKDKEDRVEHFLRQCVRTEQWRKDWNVKETDGIVKILTEEGEALLDLDRRRLE